MNFCLHPRVFRELNGCQAEIVAAIWARTDHETAIAPNLSLRQIDTDMGWSRPADVQRQINRIIKHGYLEKSVVNGVNHFKWLPRALAVSRPISASYKSSYVKLRCV